MGKDEKTDEQKFQLVLFLIIELVGNVWNRLMVDTLCDGFVGGGGQVEWLWWSSCGGVVVVEWLWWSGCGGVVVVVVTSYIQYGGRGEGKQQCRIMVVQGYTR